MVPPTATPTFFAGLILLLRVVRVATSSSSYISACVVQHLPTSFLDGHPRGTPQKDRTASTHRVARYLDGRVRFHTVGPTLSSLSPCSSPSASGELWCRGLRCDVVFLELVLDESRRRRVPSGSSPATTRAALATEAAAVAVLNARRSFHNLTGGDTRHAPRLLLALRSRFCEIGTTPPPDQLLLDHAADLLRLLPSISAHPGGLDVSSSGKIIHDSSNVTELRVYHAIFRCPPLWHNDDFCSSHLHIIYSCTR